MIVSVYKDMTLESKEKRNVMILNIIMSVFIFIFAILSYVPPLNISQFYFVRSATPNKISPIFTYEHERYIENMKAKSKIYQYSGPQHEKKKKSMIAFYDVLIFH